MILCDTGPLVALVDKDDQHHKRCVKALNDIPIQPLLTTWPCLVEAMYLLWQAGGKTAQKELWGFLIDGLLILHRPGEKEWEHLWRLTIQYQDIPMDIADASLVAVAEIYKIRSIFTIDSHFYAYRINGKDCFEVIP